MVDSLAVMDRRFDACIFDLDGTLVDSLEDLADAMNAALEDRGHARRSLGECRAFVGDGARRFVERALPPGSPAAEVDRVLAGFRGHYERRWAVKSRPYDGIPELLDAMQARGMALCVLSNKLEVFTVALVRALLPRWTFAPVRGERPGMPRKPDPAAALGIAAELKVEPARILYLGDTGTDMQTAVSSGMTPVGVLWGFRGRAELEQHGARHVVDHPRDVLALL